MASHLGPKSQPHTGFALDCSVIFFYGSAVQFNLKAVDFAENDYATISVGLSCLACSYCSRIVADNSFPVVPK